MKIQVLKKMPFFLPFAGCRGQCVYCNQRAITGVTELPSPEFVAEKLSALTEPREVCFFGGSFCRFDPGLIKKYLDAVADFAPEGSTIRFSTYPGDLCDDALRGLVRKYPIARIELGIPSLDTAVLAACRREADPEKIFQDISQLKAEGLPIGVQMMIGLPGQSRESSIADLKKLAALKGKDAWDLRLYPCLVIKGTELESLWEAGAYKPLSVAEAAEWGGEFTDLALTLGFVPIRIGLQETESLAQETTAGPHHPALGELIMAQAASRALVREAPQGPWTVDKKYISRFTGHGGYGIKCLASRAGIAPESARERLSFISRQDAKEDEE